MSISISILLLSFYFHMNTTPIILCPYEYYSYHSMSISILLLSFYFHINTTPIILFPYQYYSYHSISTSILLLSFYFHINTTPVIATSGQSTETSSKMFFRASRSTGQRSIITLMFSLQGLTFWRRNVFNFSKPCI